MKNYGSTSRLDGIVVTTDLSFTSAHGPTDQVKQLRREAQDLKEVVAEQAFELRLLKKA